MFAKENDFISGSFQIEKKNSPQSSVFHGQLSSKHVYGDCTSDQKESDVEAIIHFVLHFPNYSALTKQETFHNDASFCSLNSHDAGRM